MCEKKLIPGSDCFLTTKNLPECIEENHQEQNIIYSIIFKEQNLP